MVPKLDLAMIPQTNATGYPPPFDAAVEGRLYRRLAPVAGLVHLGASHVVLAPGAWSSQRHWHEDEDEVVVMLAGEAVLVEDAGETVLRPGDVAAFAAGTRSGHHLQNRSDADCVFVAIGAGPRLLGGDYPDIDMRFGPDGYYHRDGTPYETRRLP
ncbi:cupin domain-containing protein [Sphingomonas sp. PAMC 26617]|uniref:cupin domain-containing protein n=1 Tax=Sphingomonas sp. PAMC 26617 TaxID=1112216 RepID=UPI0002897375|nr:cupin domain-containing protein [Sphingomonas sp. PAMC 26617]